MKLKEYLDKTNLSIAGFARCIDEPHPTVLRAVQEKDIRLALAAKIEIATLGAVTCLDLANISEDEKTIRAVRRKKKLQKNKDEEHKDVA